MALGETLIFMLLVVPVTVFIFMIYLLSALGKSLGVRRKYVNTLLYIFQYGKKRIEKANREKYGYYDEDGNEAEDKNANREVGRRRSRLALPPSRSNSIQHMKLSPHSCTDKCEITEEKGCVQEDESEFHFSDIFPFIQGGIEAIVEDQVTQRFVAEELKSWNLLTRTNRHYEFISWRLSFIWVVGFFIRYFIMLPCRVTICFLGTLTLTSLTFLIGLVPEGKDLKRRLNNWVSKFCFRLLSRAFSAIVTYHTVENKPEGRGLCVANHTSPIDVVLLASDTSFALVLFLTMSTAMLGCIPVMYDGVRQRLYRICFLGSFEFLSWALSSVISHHDLENRPGRAALLNNPHILDQLQTHPNGPELLKGGGICVANHTSPIDVLMLAVDQCYDMVGQRHGGFLGILQRALARASSHIWFERSEMKDREAVARRLREHVEDANKLPILIFPEGTCINNSAVMQFKKGSFEVGGIIYPVAIKYDARFGDPFWDSSQFSMLQYLFMMMSSWAIVCDVWYLPPMVRRSDESAVDFASRVKGAIARKGGLVDLDWDGQLKRAPAKKEWKEKEQLKYSKKFSNSSSPKKHINVDAIVEPNNDNPNPST